LTLNDSSASLFRPRRTAGIDLHDAFPRPLANDVDWRVVRASRAASRERDAVPPPVAITRAHKSVARC
jgi:hypothetical protein